MEKQEVGGLRAEDREHSAGHRDQRSEGRNRGKMDDRCARMRDDEKPEVRGSEIRYQRTEVGGRKSEVGGRKNR